MIVPDRGQGVDTPAPAGSPTILDRLDDPVFLADYRPDPLLPHHRRELVEASGINPQVLADEGVLSLPSASALPVPDELVRHPDLSKASRFGQRPKVGRGFVFFYHDRAGRVASWKYKPDQPRVVVGDNGKRRTIKYEAPIGARGMLYIPRAVWDVIDDLAVPLHFVEGEKKALSLVSRGRAAIGLNGVDGWALSLDALKLVVPELAEIPLAGRTVFLELDSDAATKPEVEGARDRLAAELAGRGARVVVVAIPPGPHGEKQGPDDFLVNGGDLRALENAADVAARYAARLVAPRPGSDGADTCRGCEGLREELREHKLADTMRRARAFSTGEIEVARAYCRAVSSGLAEGKRAVSVWSEETTRLTGQSAATATRFHTAMRAFQADPAVASALPFHVIKEPDAHGKDHVRLVATAILEDPAKRRTVDILAPFTHLRRPDDRASHGGARDACPKCESPMLRTTQDRCTNDACGHVVVHKSKIVGRPPFHDETPAETVEITGDEYVTETRWVPPFHDEIKEERTYGKQDETVPGGPISFVSHADAEAAAGAYWPGRVRGGQDGRPNQPDDLLASGAATAASAPLRGSAPPVHEAVCGADAPGAATGTFTPGGPPPDAGGAPLAPATAGDGSVGQSALMHGGWDSRGGGGEPAAGVLKRAAAWRCHRCGAYERIVRPDGSWRCEGYGHEGRDRGPSAVAGGSEYAP